MFTIVGFSIRGFDLSSIAAVWIEWIESSTCCCCCCCYGFLRGCFFDRVLKGGEGIEVCWNVWRDAHSCLKRNLGQVFDFVPSCDRRFVFCVMGLMRVCVSSSIVAYVWKIVILIDDVLFWMAIILDWIISRYDLRFGTRAIINLFWDRLTLRGVENIESKFFQDFWV